MPPDPAQGLSGSETEREGDSSVFHSTSSSSSRSSRVRLASAPTSPHKTRGNASSGTPRRKRVSLASASTFDHDDGSDREHDYNNNDERIVKDRERHQDLERYQVGAARDRIRDILRDDRPSPRAPAISVTKSPISAARRRSALPREFLEGSMDEVSPISKRASHNLTIYTYIYSLPQISRRPSDLLPQPRPLPLQACPPPPPPPQAVERLYAQVVLATSTILHLLLTLPANFPLLERIQPL